MAHRRPQESVRLERKLTAVTLLVYDFDYVSDEQTQ